VAVEVNDGVMLVCFDNRPRTPGRLNDTIATLPCAHGQTSISSSVERESTRNVATLPPERRGYVNSVFSFRFLKVSSGLIDTRSTHLRSWTSVTTCLAGGALIWTSICVPGRTVGLPHHVQTDRRRFVQRLGTHFDHVAQTSRPDEVLPGR
jgi:hypothetical protein